MPVPATPSALIETRVMYCGDNLDQLRKLPPGRIDLIYIDPLFNSNRNYEVFWGETKEKRTFADECAKPYIDSVAFADRVRNGLLSATIPFGGRTGKA